MALKRRVSRGNRGLLTEVVLKHVRALPNRRLFGVASRNSKDGSKNRGRAQQSNCGQGSKTFRARQRAMNFPHRLWRSEELYAE
jgi:hypothetical protein